MGILHPAVGIPLVAVLQLAVFVLTVVASPLPQFVRGYSSRCYTYWGYKDRCSNRGYTDRWDTFECGRRRNSMKAAASFSIISIFFTLVTFLLTLLMALRYVAPTILAIIFAMISVATTLIPWAIVAAVKTENMCGNGDWRRRLRYGSGFGIMLTAWCLQVINLFLICCAGFYGRRRRCECECQPQCVRQPVCAPQPCAPQPCAPQPCAPQMCAPQPCAPQPCVPQQQVIIQAPC